MFKIMYGVKEFSLVSAAFGLTMLAACGDENTTEVTEQTGIAMLEAGKAMPECNSESAGNMVYATDSAAVYYCAEGKWQTLNGKTPEAKDGESCSAKANEDGKSYTISCPGSKDIVIKNGEDGKTPVAKDGESCSAKANEDGKSYTISCPGSEDIVVKNGKDGESAYELSGYEGSVAEWIASLKGDAGKNCAIEDAKDGEKVIGYKVTCGEDSKTILNGADGMDGVGCSADDQGNGKVVVTCGEGDSKTEQTLFKAVCGTESYEPAEAFCFEGEIYDLCNAQTYNPAKQYCLTLKDEEGDEKTTVEELLIDNRDKDNVQVYKTVKIGSQTWMAENLNYNPGDLSDFAPSAWSGCYDDKDENCTKYGRLYTWDVAMDKAGCGKGIDCENRNEGTQGVCPSGWHLPSYADWNTLFEYVDGTPGTLTAGRKLKANSSLWTTCSDVTNDDSFGFAVLPAGCRDYKDGGFDYEGATAIFWSSKEDGGYTYGWNFYYNYDRLEIGFYDKNYAFSVRCIKDAK